MKRFRSFQECVGHEFDFYGVDNLTFKLDNMIFRVVEDEDDGYRSMLGAIEKLKKNDSKGLIFFKTPIARIEVVEFNNQFSGCEDGYRLRDIDPLPGIRGKIGFRHTWLEFGTDHGDDYYPSFFFRYDPKKPTE